MLKINLPTITSNYLIVKKLNKTFRQMLSLIRLIQGFGLKENFLFFNED
jgi:adenine C2-methylase RlmN of 23S rRNA A2503 and tRNA A37